MSLEALETVLGMTPFVVFLLFGLWSLWYVVGGLYALFNELYCYYYEGY